MRSAPGPSHIGALMRSFIPFTVRHARLIATTVAFGSLALSGCDRLDLLSPAQHIAKAKNDLLAKDPRAAEIELKNALQKEPKNAGARLLLAEAYLRDGRADRAPRSSSTRRSSSGPRPAATLLLRARAYAVQRQYGRVLKTLPSDVDWLAGSDRRPVRSPRRRAGRDRATDRSRGIVRRGARGPPGLRQRALRQGANRCRTR